MSNATVTKTHFEFPPLTLTIELHTRQEAEAMLAALSLPHSVYKSLAKDYPFCRAACRESLTELRRLPINEQVQAVYQSTSAPYEALYSALTNCTSETAPTTDSKSDSVPDSEATATEDDSGPERPLLPEQTPETMQRDHQIGRVRQDNDLLKAFLHIRRMFPKVDRVKFDEDGAWEYSTPDLVPPPFGPDIDATILEAASDWVVKRCGVPSSFLYEGGSGECHMVYTPTAGWGEGEGAEQASRSGEDAPTDIGKFAIAKLKSEVEYRQGYIVSLEPLVISGCTGRLYTCEGGYRILDTPMFDEYKATDASG